MKKIERGQALVEFSLVVVMFVAILMGIAVVTPLLMNAYVAKQISAKGARAGSIYYADGTRTCLQDVLNAVGEPTFVRAEWSADVSPNCTDVPADTNVSGDPIVVSIQVDYSPLFIGGFGWPPKETADLVWSFAVETVDGAR